MLCLQRVAKESVVVSIDGREVRITILEVRGPKVRLGFQAPREIQIDRAEVAEKRRREGPRPAA
jgi:carbon storage regulator CsrA